MIFFRIAAFLTVLLMSSSLASTAYAANDPSAPGNSAGKLDVYGVSLEWDPESLWAPTGCSKFNFHYRNNSGIRLLSVDMDITSQYGDSVARGYQVGIDSGVFGTWNVQICSHSLPDGLGPYNIRLSIEDYDSSERSVTGSIVFKQRPAIINGLRAVPSTTTATVAWNQLTTAESYEIRITYNNTIKTYAAWRTVSSFYNTFKWTGLKRKTNYKVQVRALTTYGYGPESTVVFKTK